MTENLLSRVVQSRDGSLWDIMAVFPPVYGDGYQPPQVALKHAVSGVIEVRQLHGIVLLPET